MPGSLLLRYLPAAQEDLLSILEFIARDSPSRAVAFTEDLDDRIGALSKHPSFGVPLTSEYDIVANVVPHDA